MIIIGYPGIGKSTLAETYFENKYNIGYKGIIDLDSSCFHKEPTPSITHAVPSGIVCATYEVATNNEYSWVEAYCKVAENLSKQGFVVFVSAHESVQIELRKTDEHVIVCYPALTLREEWIKKLRERYTASIMRVDEYTRCGSRTEDKNFKAYNRACNNYENDIIFMSGNGFESIVIEDMYYSLKSLIFGTDTATNAIKPTEERYYYDNN